MWTYVFLNINLTLISINYSLGQELENENKLFGAKKEKSEKYNGERAQVIQKIHIFALHFRVSGTN